jgi:multimeric flavodoxin WrbA
MEIVVLHGSPKGATSVTNQYAEYVKKVSPNHSFRFLSIGHEVKAVEAQEVLLRPIIDAVAAADAIIWTFPVFYMLVPGQMKRFLDHVSSRDAASAFSGKYATSISTSVHFFDHLAHDFMHAVSEDLGMHYVDGFSAEMNDLFNRFERANLARFAKSFLDIAENKRPVPKRYPPLKPYTNAYSPDDCPKPAKPTGFGRIALITDAGPDDDSLNNMIRVYTAATNNLVDRIDVKNIGEGHGCLECYRCANEGHCFCNDEVEEIYRKRVFPADAILFAPKIVGRFFSGHWKEFIDRSFFNGHRGFPGIKQTGYLISGPLRQLPDLRQWCQVLPEIGMNTSLCHFATDEDPTDAVTANVREMARLIDAAIDDRARKPMTFRGVGGHMVLRDLVLRQRFVFRADYQYYRRNRLFDYPNRELGRNVATGLANMAMAIPSVRRMFERNMRRRMVEPYRKVVEETDDAQPKDGTPSRDDAA